MNESMVELISAFFFSLFARKIYAGGAHRPRQGSSADFNLSASYTTRPSTIMSPSVTMSVSPAHLTGIRTWKRTNASPHKLATCAGWKSYQ